MTPYVSLCQNLATSLGKEIYEFEIMGDDEAVIGDTYKPFIKSLIHVFRNSVDHGLEDPETRVENGKDEVGTISCSFSQENNKFEIIVSDDGAGINKEMVLKKALEEGIVTEDKVDSLSDSEIYYFIFSENFSTKEEVTDISGRGVGMNAVKVEIEKLGGTIEISTQENVGTSFTFSVPFEEREI